VGGGVGGWGGGGGVGGGASMAGRWGVDTVQRTALWDWPSIWALSPGISTPSPCTRANGHDAHCRCGNNAAIMEVSENMEKQFTAFEPAPRKGEPEVGGVGGWGGRRGVLRCVEFAL
jgi:hypothetical protein